MKKTISTLIFLMKWVETMIGRYIQEEWRYTLCRDALFRWKAKEKNNREYPADKFKCLTIKKRLKKWNSSFRKIHRAGEEEHIVDEPNHTSLGAMMWDNVMVFSGGISAFVLPIINRVSPDGTAFTLPLSHPVAAGAAAMVITMACNPTI